MSPKIADQIFQVSESEIDSQPSNVEYQFAYQARIAIDRIRFAITEAEKLSPDSERLREVTFQLVDALDRLESPDRNFQRRFRDRSPAGKSSSKFGEREGS